MIRLHYLRCELASIQTLLLKMVSCPRWLRIVTEEVILLHEVEYTSEDVTIGHYLAKADNTFLPTRGNVVLVESLPPPPCSKVLAAAEFCYVIHKL